MGEKNNAEKTMYYSIGDTFEKIESVKQFPSTEEIIECGELPFDFGKDYVVYGGFKLQKRFRCKSRKRFAKLIMAQGYPREYAVWLAKTVQKIGISYSDAWFKLMIFGGL